MMLVMHVAGARPNFMKLAPVMEALNKQSGIEQILVHTGQHYDRRMSQVFFEELELPEPHLNLGVGSASHARQTAEIMVRFEDLLLESRRPDLVLVYGDVNSTVAAALVCAKLLIPLGHVEAGLRSFDRTMPEEVNRVLTDRIADLLFTPSRDADQNLLREGTKADRIHFVGNVMIDTLVRLLPRAEQQQPLKRLGIDASQYGLVTLHRPSNVDEPEALKALIEALQKVGRRLPLVFPVHPRTRQQMSRAGLRSDQRGLHLIAPLGYLEFLSLQNKASVVITDSGGIQEETTFLGVPCLTLRANTERPVTVEQGTNQLLGQDVNRMVREVEKVLAGQVKPGTVPELWDGSASDRIARLIVEWAAKTCLPAATLT